PQGSRKSWEWVGPPIFISQTMLSSMAVSLTLSIVTSYLYDLLKTHLRDIQVTLEFIIETEGNSKITKNRIYKHIIVKGTPKEIRGFDVYKLQQIAEKERTKEEVL